MKRVIIIGATSGIGRALATLYVAEGWAAGITGRRKVLLDELSEQLGGNVLARVMDVADTTGARRLFDELVASMGGVDLVIISAGTGYLDPFIPWETEMETVQTNVTGFASIAHAAFEMFRRQGYGHLAGISSIAAVRGGPAPAYNASKAFVSRYLEGLRCVASSRNLPIYVTDILPGFVDTAMAKGEGLFWIASPERAARDIFNAIGKKKRRVWITGRWRFVALLLQFMPERLYTVLVCGKKKNTRQD
ncbi:MAG: SDR family NAD(P)-dependent oxidoreductase [Chlorobiaceae bacterium]|nr:SDR family NAD(P)-dependent oxidoreductase [Chlorobiaceae bacterium]